MISIEFMKEDDLDAVLEVERDCFSVPWSKKAFLGDLSNEHTVYLAAKDDGKIVGYAGVWCVFEDADITNVAVLKSHRRLGIASKLITGIILEAKKRDVSNIRLEVRKSNEPAITLYKKFGFLEIGIRKNYYEDNHEDALLMEKKIVLEE